ncbi:MAG TPA: hypothetical protein VF595_05995 [Tepidisphaeraceae bacterium]|jgi:hypothetical protein
MSKTDYERKKVGRVLFIFAPATPQPVRDACNKVIADEFMKLTAGFEPPAPGIEPELTVTVTPDRDSVTLLPILPPSWRLPEVPEDLRKLFEPIPEVEKQMEQAKEYAKQQFRAMNEAVERLKATRASTAELIRRAIDEAGA